MSSNHRYLEDVIPNIYETIIRNSGKERGTLNTAYIKSQYFIDIQNRINWAQKALKGINLV